MKLSLAFPILFLLLNAVGLSAAAQNSEIKITKALWSGKDVTAEAAEFCDGKSECEYKVSPEYIGEAKNPKNKSFKIAWSCGPEGQKPTPIQKPHDATDEVLNIVCVDKPDPGEAAKQAALAKAIKNRFVPTTLSKQDPLWPLKVPVSLHSFIKNPNADKVEASLEDDCVKALRQHMAAGKNFRTNRIEKFIVPMKNFPNAEAADLKLNHYTNAEDMETIVKTKNYNSIFNYTRTELDNNLIFFYVAGDEVSSASYGKIHILVSAKQDSSALLLEENDLPGNEMDSENAQKWIAQGIVAKNPKLSTCSDSMLTYLAAESYGVGFIAYYGARNQIYTDAAPHVWLEVIGPWAIDNMKVVP